MKVKVYPCKLSGTAVVPASKSYAHRALICAALADGESKVECADMNDDIRATIRTVTALGAKVKYSEGILTVNGITGRVKEDIVIDCGESGSTLRFIIPVALTLCDGYVRFVGGGAVRGGARGGTRTRQKAARSHRGGARAAENEVRTAQPGGEHTPCAASSRRTSA